MRSAKNNANPKSGAKSCLTATLRVGPHSQHRRLLVIDNHEIGLTALKHYFAARTSFKIATLWLDRVESLLHPGEPIPDLVLVNLGMAGFDGAVITRLLLKAAPASKVVGFNGVEDRQAVLSMLRAGARGYVLNTCSSSELLRALERVRRGELFFSPTILRMIAEDYALNGVRFGEGSPDELSEQERKVVAFVADGHSNKEIADRLKTSVRTIEKHRERLMAKLRIKTISGLTKFAIRCGITSLD